MTNVNNSEILRLNTLERNKSAEYVQDVFANWLITNWFWLALDGGGGVGKSEAQKYIEQFGMGLSAGDYFRGANRILTNLGYTEQDVKDIHRELHNMTVTTKIIKDNKKVVLRYKREKPEVYEPEGSGENGLRNPELKRSLTDFLSADPVAVRWWKLQVRKTLRDAAKKRKPVITVGRTHREIRQDKKQQREWRVPLSRAVFGYIYANKETLAARSTNRAVAQYTSRAAKFQQMTLQEFINYSVNSDWERTVLEMTRENEQLARPEQAHKLRADGIYDYVLNTSQLDIEEVNALHSAAIMAFISKNHESAAMYQAFYEVLKYQYNVPEEDPELQVIEEQISETSHQLDNRGELETA